MSFASMDFTTTDTININAPNDVNVTGMIQMNNNRIKNLADAVAPNDGVNKSYADGRYYLNTVPLNNITAPTGSLSMSSRKIINMLPGTSPNDAVNFS
jgi:hypothetical protein